MLDEATKARFETALVAGKLRELCEQMQSEGLTQVAIYEKFSKFQDFLGGTDRNSDYDLIVESLECIVGWCSPGARWFDHYLTNEEIYAYQSGVPEKDVHEVFALILKEKPKEMFHEIRKEPDDELSVKTMVLQPSGSPKFRIYTVQRRSAGWKIMSEKIDHIKDAARSPDEG